MGIFWADSIVMFIFLASPRAPRGRDPVCPREGDEGGDGDGMPSSLKLRHELMAINRFALSLDMKMDGEGALLMGLVSYASAALWIRVGG